MCSELKKIILKNNKITESDNLTFLSSLTNLEYLDMRNNPICESKNANEEFENNLNEIKILIWKKEDEKKVIDIVSEYDDLLIDSVPQRKQYNKIDKEVNEIINKENEEEEEEDEEEEENEEDKKINNNQIKNDKNELLSSIMKNNPIKKSKIQIDAVQKINIPKIDKNKIILNNSNSLKNITNNSQNSFRSTLIKKQPLKPIKVNKELLNNKSIGSITTSSSGTQSSKEKPGSAFKIKINEGNNNVKINPINKIKITKK